MYGTGGMYPAYGYNQTPFSNILAGINQAIGGFTAGSNSPTGYFQPTLGDTYNQGMFSGTNGVILIGVIILAVVLLVR